MTDAIELLKSLFLGVGLFGLLYVWKRLSIKWTHWFPAIKKTAEIGMKLLIAGAAIWAGLFVSGEDDNWAQRLMAFAVGAAIPFIYLKLSKASALHTVDSVKRGTNVASAADVRKAVFTNSRNTRVSIGPVPVPADMEPYHFLIAGATGTGKSVAINHFLQALRTAGDTVILVDSGGDFLSKHYVEGTDFVFNPYDDRCVNWSPLLEIQGEWDSDALARSMIPDATGENKEWNSYAQTFVASVLRKLWSTNRLTLRDLLYYILVAPVPELKEFLEGTAAVAQMSSEKTFGSIRTIASNYVKAYGDLPGKGDLFSVSEMISAEHSGFLFLTYRDDQLDSLKSLIACILDVAARSILSLQPNSSRRIWLVIDEFASIGRVQSVEAMATKARKVGGCLLIGLQTVSQLKDKYGEHGAQTILSCLSSWLVLRCSDADTAEYMSKYVGDVELVRHSKSMNVSESGDSHGKNEQVNTQRAVLASEIQALPNLKGYLKLAGGYPLCEITLETKTLNKPSVLTHSFVKRDAVAKPLLDFSAPTGIPSTTAKKPQAEDSRSESASSPEQPTRDRDLPVRQGAQASRVKTVKGVSVGLKPAPNLRHTHEIIPRSTTPP